MNSREYIPAVRHLVALLEAKKGELQLDDVRALNRVKNWLRTHDEKGISSAKVTPRQKHHNKDRGIAI